MKLPGPVFALLAFASAFGVMRYFTIPVPLKTSTISATGERDSVPRPAASTPQGIASPDLLSQLSAILALPPSQRNDEALSKLSELLLPDDPEAAFRASMARWGYARGLVLSAEALVKKDPAAARRLLADCPDLRSKSALMGAIMADEVRRNPREKLRWAEETLEGEVKLKAVAAGSAALALLDPAAALEFAAGLPPGALKLGTSNKTLIAAFGKDPGVAMQWLREIPSRHERALLSGTSFWGFSRDHPETARATLPKLQGELQEAFGSAFLANKLLAIKDPSEYFSKASNEIKSFPAEIRLPVIRTLAYDASNSDERDGRTIPKLLSVMTKPEERAAVIETIMAARFSRNEDSTGKSPEMLAAQQKTLGFLQTPEDKQAAARVVPFFTNLSDAQRQDLLHRLK